MALFYNDKKIESVHLGSQAIATIYRGSKLLWEAIRSCFGKGFWNNKYSWNNDDGWKNNTK